MNVTQTVETMGQDVKKTGRSLWLASLGAASSMRENSRQLFDRLVERGQSRKEQGFAVPETVQQAGEKVGDRVKGFGREVEARVEEGVTSTMKRFGVPVRQDFQQLIERIEQLTVKVEGLSKS